MKILGLHPFGHDSTIVLLDSQAKTLQTFTLERFSRKKHDMNYVLPSFSKIIEDFSPDVISVSNNESRPADVNMFKYLQNIYEINSKSRKKSLKISELINLIKEKILLRISLIKRNKQSLDDFIKMIQYQMKAPVICNDHHDCHAYSALWTSELIQNTNVLVVTIDGQGDKACATLSIANHGKITRQVTVPNAYSLCILYSYFTEIAGFNPNADEGKLEALACYYEKEESALLNDLRNWIVFDENTLEFKINPTKKIPFNAIPQNRRQIRHWLRNIYQKMDPREFAFAMQVLFEEKYLAWISAAKKKFDCEYVCMAGGGIANVKLNLRVFEEAGFSKVHIVPAMGDDGVALGSAIMAGISNNMDMSFIANEKMPYWGMEPNDNEIEMQLLKAKHIGHYVEGPLNDEELALRIATLLGDNKICAVYRGKAEYGPRALGHRSILANPTNPNARDDINNKFKMREWFQPFCPIMTEEDAEHILQRYYSNKHMTCAFRVKPEFSSAIPSVVHVDNTARAQIINKNDEPFIHNIMTHLKNITGYAVLLNTSFNLHGRAMVNTPKDALDDFTDCGLDYLAMGNYLVMRKPC